MDDFKSYIYKLLTKCVNECPENFETQNTFLFI